MNNLVVCCLFLLSLSSPLLSFPIEESSEAAYRLPDRRANLDEVNSLDRTYLLPAFLDKHSFGAMAEDYMLKKDADSPVGYIPNDNVKTAFYGKHPRNTLLSRLLSKDRKQYNKRGNLSECFWKYCV